MRIVYARAALGELDTVWEWNAQRYGGTHADDYVGFLRQGIDALAANPEAGRTIEGFPELRRITLRRRPRGDGHTVIYQISPETIDVLHVYHTKQDFSSRLLGE